jgi:hypothetical protein
VKSSQLTLVLATIVAAMTLSSHAASGAVAPAIAFGPSYDGGSGASSLGYVMGYKFHVSAPTVVTELGFYDYANDGLNAAHDVGLWSTADTVTPLATASFLNGDNSSTTGVTAIGTPTYGVYLYRDITDLTLPAGDYMVAAVVGNGLDVGISSPQNFSVNSQITILEANYIGPGNFALTYPTLTASTSTGPGYVPDYLFPNFLVQVPEPATGFVLLVGAAPLMLSRARGTRTVSQ